MDIESMLISLPADVHIVHVGSLLLIGCDGDRGGYRRLGHLLHLHAPLVLRLLEVGQAELRLTVGDGHVDTVFAKDAVDLGDHLIGIGC